MAMPITIPCQEVTHLPLGMVGLLHRNNSQVAMDNNQVDMDSSNNNNNSNNNKHQVVTHNKINNNNNKHLKSCNQVILMPLLPTAVRKA